MSLNIYERDLPVKVSVDPHAFLRILTRERASALLPVNKLSVSITAETIRDLLSTLQNLERLNKSAIQGADFALNFRGEIDLYDPDQYSNFNYINKGDFFIHKTSPDDFLREGDWLLALGQGDILDPSLYQSQTYFKVLKLSRIEACELDIVCLGTLGETHTSTLQSILVNDGDTLKFEARILKARTLPIKYEWVLSFQDLANQGTANYVTIGTKYGLTSEFTFDQEGTYTLSLEVSDIAGNQIALRRVENWISLQGSGTFSLSILVTDYGSGTIQGASVVVNGIERTTMADGRVQFVNLPEDTYSIVVSKDGFQEVIDSVFLDQNIVDYPVTLELDPEVTIFPITGEINGGGTAIINYGFTPSGYEGATEVTTWVEQDGAPVTPEVTKIKGEPNYNEFIVPSGYPGAEFHARVKGYDVQNYHNPIKMLKTIFAQISAQALPVYFGYRRLDQSNVINQAIMENTGAPETSVIDLSSQVDFPGLLKAFFSDFGYEFQPCFPWIAIPHLATSSNYQLFCAIKADGTLNTSFTYGVDTRFDSTVIVDSNSNTYQVYYRKTANPTVLEDLAFTLTDFSPY